MFGRTMAFEVGKFSVRMRPFESVEEYQDGMMGINSHKVTKYMDFLPFGHSKEDEQKSFEHIRGNKRNVWWAIEHIEDEKLIGYTNLFNWNPVARTYESTIMIWNSKYWNMKITSHVHLARTYYGAKILNLAAMRSYVLTDNQASYKSLVKSGYERFGTLESFYFVEGKYLDAHHMVWYNPTEAGALFADGVPKGKQSQLKRAKEALEKAEDIIIFP